MSENTEYKQLTRLSQSTFTLFGKSNSNNEMSKQSLINNINMQDDVWIPTIKKNTEYIINSQQQHNMTNSNRRDMTNRSMSRLRQKNKYQIIEQILNRQNSNLKQQNYLLMKQINNLKTTNKTYKNKYRIKLLEAQQIKQQCIAHQKRGDQFMNIILSRLKTLEESTKKKSLETSACSFMPSTTSIASLTLQDLDQ